MRCYWDAPKRGRERLPMCENETVAPARITQWNLKVNKNNIYILLSCIFVIVAPQGLTVSVQAAVYKIK